MSKHNTVNPGQYKIAGRERPDTLARERQKTIKRKANKPSRKTQRRSTGSGKKV
jgi:hypothetical protein